MWSGSYGLFGYFARRNSTWPPAGLALLAAVCEENGHEAFIIDGQAEGLSVEEMVERTIAEKPDIVGFSSFSPFFHVQITMAEALKKAAPEIQIMIGGPHITIVKQKAMQPCLDYLFVGEAEETLPAFLERLERGEDLEGLKGVIYQKDGKTHFAGPARPVQDFDSLPMPARHLLNNNVYKIGTLKGRRKFASVQTMRGCPWKCIFCASEDLNTTRILERSPEMVVADIKDAVENYGLEHIHFLDDVLTLHRERIEKICDLIEAEGLDITFEGSTRANLVDEPLIKRMAECGLVRLSFGLETVDPEMRKTMNKKVPLKYYVEANRILNKHGVEALNSVMIGLPGETRETVRSLLDFLAKSRDIKQANLAIAVPYPGTVLHDMATSGEHGITLHTDDFSKYRRYGSAVTTVNGLTPKDLVDLQNEGFVSIYSAPWRWRPMFMKFGVIGALLMLLRLARLIGQKLVRNVLRYQPPAGEPAIAVGHAGSPKSPHL
jgi:radical SAM superfamily enzyme YgiQ (UPF0313 family)